MTQHFFNGEATSDKANLDGNFNDLYGRTALQSLVSDQTTFAGSIVSRRSGSGGTSIYTDNTLNASYQALLFLTNNSATTVGSISCTTTATAFNTSSDYRLKDDVQPLGGSGSFIDALLPRSWTWKSTGAPGSGFIAHELQAVSPSSVTGTKDAVQAVGTVSDAGGNPVLMNTPCPDVLRDGATWVQTGTQPVYQMVEYASAEVFAMVIAELQDLRRRVAALEAA